MGCFKVKLSSKSLVQDMGCVTLASSQGQFVRIVTVVAESYYYNLLYVHRLVVLTILKNMSSSMGRIIPYIMENKKCLKPPVMYHSHMAHGITLLDQSIIHSMVCLSLPETNMEQVYHDLPLQCDPPSVII
jgi:hypothetical protein